MTREILEREITSVQIIEDAAKKVKDVLLCLRAEDYELFKEISSEALEIMQLISYIEFEAQALNDCIFEDGEDVVELVLSENEYEEKED